MFKAKNLWIIHLVGWALFISLPLTIVSREPSVDFQIALLTSWSFWLFLLIYCALFYFNLLIWIPKLFLKQRYVWYATIFIGLFAVTYVSQPFEKLLFRKFHQGQQMQPDEMKPGQARGQVGEFRDMRPRPPRAAMRPRAVDFVSLILFILVWIVAMAVRISEQWRLSERRAILSEAEKAQAELSFFKAQINPHFLFNTLNNIYALAVSSSQHTAPSILKLSQMMRYITEEAIDDYVPLEDELACLENYIELQKLRLNAKTTLEYNVAGFPGNMRITPLILMTFVENAFKYGVSNHRESVICVKVDVLVNEIVFFCQNRIIELRKEVESTGIGMSNTRKRLDFLYAGQYDLNIGNDGEFFTVHLKLAGR
ncbi:sensor histidine kinase [Dyadobacter sp. MSC1_007]|jgi:two-component system LytT family sensor kinase|uniref:sensor histidine kinase n=1 Tax=Dyadobacter sp. MSC1_007 TaxID=2909264 RepID=UPI002030F1BE|nr:sensor histidine kinase [Dyadobacter sp. MSC1_007]